MIFPILCPQCAAASGRTVIPDSPEVDTFRCGDCAHHWSEPRRVTASLRPTEGMVTDAQWRAALNGGPAPAGRAVVINS